MTKRLAFRLASALGVALTAAGVLLGTGPSTGGQVPAERQCYSCWT